MNTNTENPSKIREKKKKLESLTIKERQLKWRTNVREYKDEYPL